MTKLSTLCGLGIGAAALLGCQPKTQTQTPEPPPPPVVDRGEEEVEEPAGPARRVGDDAIAVGTFNLNWAHDSLNERKPTKLAAQHQAKTEEDWAWKVDGIARLLIAEQLDVIALQEVGGEAELADIKLAIQEQGGPEYFIGFVESNDSFTGHNVGLLSRYMIVDERRLDVHMRKHIAADVELPNGDVVTFIGIHARGGKYPNQERARAKQTRALKRKIEAMREERAVVILGTTNSSIVPGDSEYATSSIGVLAGANTKQPEDDCQDSGDFLAAQVTTIHDEIADRIVTCGLKMADAETTGNEAILSDEPDPPKLPWSAVPLKETPFRDLSDHYILWAEVSVATKPSGSDNSAVAAP